MVAFKFNLRRYNPAAVAEMRLQYRMAGAYTRSRHLLSLSNSRTLSRINLGCTADRRAQIELKWERV
jgi:hypothetical protein